MRIRYMAFVLALLLLAGCGCSADQPSDAETTPAETTYSSPYSFPDIEPMQDELRERVEKAYDDYMWFDGWASPFEPHELRYYGTYGEIVVIFDSSSEQMETTKIIAGEKFNFNTSFFLCAYHDGNIVDLNDAYEQGLISAENVAEVAQIHLQFNMWLYPNIYGN